MIEALAGTETATGTTETMTVAMAAATEIVTMTMTTTMTTATGRVKVAGATGASIVDLSGPTGTLGMRTTGDLNDHEGTEGCR